MITLGVCAYIIVTLSKPAFVSKNYTGLVDLLLSSVKLEFQKNNPASPFSFLQLWSMAWIVIGAIELLLSRQLSEMPNMLVTFLELSLPLALTILIVRRLQK